MTATAGSMQPVTDPSNSAFATGGNGGNGGIGAPGGDATATAATTVISGSAEADATAIGGNGGNFGASAIFGNDDGYGGNASASSTAVTSGSGDASSSANATGGAMAYGDFGFAGSASAVADAAAAGGGKAVATAFATGGPPGGIVAGFSGAANATSNAKTVNGAMADAQSIAVPGAGGSEKGQASSTAKTRFAGVSVEATATAPNNGGGPTGAVVVAASTDAIAQGGSGQSPPVNPELFNGFAFSTALPNAAYATTLIGSASNVADALLGPDHTIFGTAILGGSDSSSTFDLSFRGDLILGVIAGGYLDIVANGTDILSEDVGDNTIINLGSIFGPNIDLTIEGDGVFAFGGAVPEPSTWAMMLLGFAGLGFAGYRSTRRGRRCRPAGLTLGAFTRSR